MDNERVAPGRTRAFAEGQVSGGRHGSASEYVRELIRRDQDRSRLRELLLEGAAGPIVGRADEECFSSLRDRVGEAGNVKPSEALQTSGA